MCLCACACACVSARVCERVRRAAYGVSRAACGVRRAACGVSRAACTSTALVNAINARPFSGGVRGVRSNPLLREFVLTVNLFSEIILEIHVDCVHPNLFKCGRACNGSLLYFLRPEIRNQDTVVQEPYCNYLTHH